MGERVSSHDGRRLGLVGTAAMVLSTGCALAVENRQATQPIGANTHNCQVIANSYSREENGKPLPADNTDLQINIIVIFDINNSISEPVELYLKHEDAGSFTSVYDYSTRKTANYIPNNNGDPDNPNRGRISALGLYRDRDYYSNGFGATHDLSFKVGDYDVKVVSESEDADSYCAITNAFEVVEASTG